MGTTAGLLEAVAELNSDRAGSQPIAEVGRADSARRSRLPSPGVGVFVGQVLDEELDAQLPDLHASARIELHVIPGPRARRRAQVPVEFAGVERIEADECLMRADAEVVLRAEVRVHL